MIKMKPLNSTSETTPVCTRVKAWSSGVKGPSAKHHCKVVLKEDGELRVKDLTSNQVLWSSRPSNIGTAASEIIEEAPCMPSGNKSVIKKQVLSLAFPVPSCSRRTTTHLMRRQRPISCGVDQCHRRWQSTCFGSCCSQSIAFCWGRSDCGCWRAQCDRRAGGLRNQGT